MSKSLMSLLALIAFLAVAPLGWAHAAPEEVALCELAKHPKFYEGKTIRVRGTLSVEFEDFTLVNKEGMRCTTGHLAGLWWRRARNSHFDALFVITQVSDVQSVPPADLDVRGTLLGPNGKPMEGFVVFDDVLGGSPPERKQTLTNGKGEFEFSISGQQLRFENPSYRPIALPVEPGRAHVRVKLEDAKTSDWLVLLCGAEMNPASRIGFSVLFLLPTTMESRPFNTAIRSH